MLEVQKSSLLGSGLGSGLSDNDWGSDWCGFGLLGSLLLLEVLGEELLVSNVGLLSSLPLVDLDSLVDDLSSDSLLGDESLDLWCLVEGLVSSLDLSSDNVLGDIVLLSKSESSSDVVSSLWSESSWSLVVSESFDFTLALDENLECDDSKIWSTNASSNGFPLSLSGSSWSVKSGSYN